MQELLKRALGYGAAFPDLYDWTWGEAVSFVNAHVAREKEQYRMQAMMDLTHAATLAKMVTGTAGRVSVMDVYSFLWTKEERQAAKLERLRAQLEAKAQGKEVSTHGRSIA